MQPCHVKVTALLYEIVYRETYIRTVRLFGVRAHMVARTRRAPRRRRLFTLLFGSFVRARPRY